MTNLYIDADACPVKDEVYRVADRYRLSVFVVSNSWIRVPQNERITRVVDTADIPLADRALKAGAQVVHPTGRPFTPDSIGSALASRMVGEHLRSIGEVTRGPKPFTSSDRSRFLQALDAAVVRAGRR